jgi:hypothetical protein
MTDIGTALGSAVIFLFAGSGTVPIGTAFIIGFPVPGMDNQFVPLVVTAKHVVGDQEKVYGRFTSQEGKAPGLVEYDLKSLRASGDLWEHKDSGVDIVVFRTPHFAQAKYEPVPLDLIASKEIYISQKIQSTDRVVFPGLLINFLGSAKNYPVTRNGSIALISDEPVPMKYKVGSKEILTKQEIILIDGIAVPGASGSPVFLWPGPRIQGDSFTLGTKPYILGVLHGFYPALPREIYEVNTSGTSMFFSENSGIAIVFPSWRLREIVEYPEVIERIKAIVK